MLQCIFFFWVRSLRPGLRELEQLLHDHPVLFSSFRSSGRALQLLFASGAVATASVAGAAGATGDLQRISVDRFLVGRVLDFASDAQFSRRHLVVSYLDSRLTFVTFGRSDSSPGGGGDGEDESGWFEQPLDRMEPRVALLDVLGPAGRR